MDDLIIRGAQVIDGSGAPGRAVDVAICDGRIRALASGLTGPAQRVIEATGQVMDSASQLALQAALRSDARGSSGCRSGNGPTP